MIKYLYFVIYYRVDWYNVFPSLEAAYIKEIMTEQDYFNIQASGEFLIHEAWRIEAEKFI